jgi:hypothetical protein
MKTDLEWVLTRLHSILTEDKSQEDKLRTITDVVNAWANEISLPLK